MKGIYISFLLRAGKDNFKIHSSDKRKKLKILCFFDL